jgi:hypothetical protein
VIPYLNFNLSWEDEGGRGRERRGEGEERRREEVKEEGKSKIVDK